MINILISNTNLRYSIDLLNIISPKNPNIRVREIAQTTKETIKAINNSIMNIDIALLDFNLAFSKDISVFDKIKNTKRYYNSFIIIAEDLNETSNLCNNEFIYSIISKDASYSKINTIINECIEHKEH